MYAVIESGGKQYRVEKGQSLLVDRLSADEGAKVGLRAVMFRDKRVVAAPKALEKVKVEAKVAEHLRGPKIKVFKYKAKKGYRRRAGPPLRADPARGHRAEAAESPRPRKPAEKKPAAEKRAAANKESPMAHKKGLGSSRNGAIRTPSCSASRSSPARRSAAARSSCASAAPASTPATGVGLGRDHTIFATRPGRSSSSPRRTGARSRFSADD